MHHVPCPRTVERGYGSRYHDVKNEPGVDIKMSWRNGAYYRPPRAT